jgi:hypothetical protein
MSQRKVLKDLILAHKGQFFGVDFIKQDGTQRTIKRAQIGYKQGHDGDNTVAHLDQYVTVVEVGEADTSSGSYPGKPKFRNVNVDSIKRLSIGGMTIFVK